MRLQLPEWKPSCCLHFLPLTATYCLLLVLAVWLPKHRGAGRALLDITPMGTHWLTLLGSWQTELFIFHFFLFFFFPRLVHGSARLLLGQKKNRKRPWREAGGALEEHRNCHVPLGLGWSEQFLKAQGAGCVKISRRCQRFALFHFSQLCFHCLRWRTGSPPGGHVQRRDNATECHHLFFTNQRCWADLEPKILRTKLIWRLKG